MADDRYWDDLKWNSEDDIDGPDDVAIPITAHHMQAQAELNIMLESGLLSVEEVNEAMTEWKQQKKLANGIEVDTAVRALKKHGVIDNDEANDIKQRA
jgi:hypothetical protein